MLDNEKCEEEKKVKQGRGLRGIEKDVENILEGMRGARLLKKEILKQRPDRRREPIIK